MFVSKGAVFQGNSRTVPLLFCVLLVGTVDIACGRSATTPAL
ncbi:MAG: hypothetical protein ACOX42_02310 [Clostridia bacterium]